MSNTKNTGGPAFPTAMEEHHEGVLHFDMPGMTLRDYFAAKALPAIVAAYVEANGRLSSTDHIHYNCSAHAYKMADAMLIAREQ